MKELEKPGRSSAEGNMFLKFEDLRVKRPLGVVYNVFLNLPPHAEPRADSPSYVGTLSFFGVTAEARSPKSIAMPMEAPLQRLLRGGRAISPMTVTLLPTRPPASDAAPTIARILLVGENP
ncbi:MAG: hypothetical protein ACJ8AT_32755 [Hyalangium sp.]|uniref:DUF7868 domain-containing protein n=1 Tax=Hyalangium sp. TaxID=2028555 RepID=UPI00389A3F80